MLWTVEAKNTFEKKQRIIPVFISEGGDLFTAYAQDFWKDLSLGNLKGTVRHDTANPQSFFATIEKKAEEYLERYYSEMETEIKKRTEGMRANKEKAHAFQLKQIEKIGIDTIRNYRREKLLREYHLWNENFKSSSYIVPSLQCSLIMKVCHG